MVAVGRNFSETDLALTHTLLMAITNAASERWVEVLRAGFT